MEGKPNDPTDASASDFLNEKTLVTTIASVAARSSKESGSLVAISGPDLGKRYDIRAPTMTIGRSSGCEVRLDQDAVSRKHVMIVDSGKSVLIRDLGSTNGTYVNDMQVDEYVLRDGDYIEVGRTIFKFLSRENIEGAYHAELHRLTTVDGPTQALNKRSFLERIEERPENLTDVPSTNTFIALKVSLPRVGESEDPDAVLRALVREVNLLVRRDDLVGRYSDSVLAVCSELDFQRARFLCEQIADRKARTDSVLLARSSLSIGLVESSETKSPTLLVKEALWRAEAASRLGGDRIVDHAVSFRNEPGDVPRSTFISYGGPDLAFAKRLNDALRIRGVQTFFFQNDATTGAKLHDVMRSAVNAHDRVILVCSKDSLERPGLLNELEETLAREARDGGATYLLPIRLDDYVIKQWKPKRAGLAQTIRDRVIADFCDHANPVAFSAAVTHLMAALTKREEEP